MAKKDIDLGFLIQGVETLELPSRGLVYPANNALSTGSIHIRPWLTAEEKLIDKFNRNNYFSVLKRLVENAIEEKVDVSDMSLGDFFFVLYWIRQITYGSAYTTNVVCPHCGMDVVTEIDIANFEVKYLQEEFSEPIEMEMPISGIKIKLRLPRLRDVIDATESTHASTKKLGVNISPELYKTAKCVTEMVLNNKEKDLLTDKEDFGLMINRVWPRISAADYSAVKEKLATFDHGYTGTTMTKCPKCEDLIEQGAILSTAFFRSSDRQSDADN